MIGLVLNGTLAVDSPFKRHLVNGPWNLPKSSIAIGRPDNKHNFCRLGKNEVCLRRGFPLVAFVTMSKSNRGKSFHITNAKLLFHSYCFKLIGYWRLKRNYLFHTFPTYRQVQLYHSKIYKISQ